MRRLVIHILKFIEGESVSYAQEEIKRPGRGGAGAVRVAALLMAAILAVAWLARGQEKKVSVAPRPIRHVMIVSVDGLPPESYTAPDKHALRVPTLRELAARGAASDGALSVLPSVTYPAHTSIATGTNPGTHSIVTNLAWDPTERNREGWRWYAEDIRVKTLWQAAREKNLSTALLNWPVTVGARADWLVPEVWRASNAEDQKLTRALSTPGLLDAVVRRFPDFWSRYMPPGVKDSSTADVAVHLIETRRPRLLMAHIFEVDHWQHEKGPWSAEAIAAIENADAQIARIIAAARKAGTWNDTLLIVVSDHGFRRYSKRVRPGIYLARENLISFDERNRIADWKAVVSTATGVAFFYVKDPGDTGTMQKLRQIFEPLAGAPGSGIARIFSREQIIAQGGDPGAFLALEAAEGFAFQSGYAGDLIFDAPTPAGHGWPPDAPDMRASLIFAGPRVAAGKLDGARLIDVAPTVAKILGLSLPQAEGRPLPVRIR
jgi:predicted AlkP superfamily pyrophosphatase or phosphodiesterase